MNSDIFSFQRFGNYVNLHLLSNKKRLLQLSLTMIGIMVFVDAILPFFTDPYSGHLAELYKEAGIDAMWPKEVRTFCIFLVFFVFVAASEAFFTYNSKESRIRALTLPASNLEKFMTYFLVYVVGVYVVFVIGFFLTDYIRIALAPFYAGEDAVVKPLPLEYFFNFGNKQGFDYFDVEAIKVERMAFTTSLLQLGAMFFLFSSIWPKNSRRKGLLTLLVIGTACVLTALLGFRVAQEMYGPYMVKRFKEFAEYLDISFNTYIIVSYCSAIVWTVCLYVLSYFRFKEMESIERW